MTSPTKSCQNQGINQPQLIFPGHWTSRPRSDFPVEHQEQLPEFMNFKLFGKTILVVNVKFGLFLGHPRSQ